MASNSVPISLSPCIFALDPNGYGTSLKVLQLFHLCFVFQPDSKSSQSKEYLKFLCSLMHFNILVDMQQVLSKSKNKTKNLNENEEIITLFPVSHEIIQNTDMNKFTLKKSFLYIQSDCSHLDRIHKQFSVFLMISNSCQYFLYFIHLLRPNWLSLNSNLPRKHSILKK